jgi:DHA1 family bicyclomycin/chloramphenicol resistance-like MFS transporter
MTLASPPSGADLPALPLPASAPAGTAPTSQASPLSPAFAAVVLALLLGLQPITTDLMLPALPAMAGDLHAGMAAAQLTMSALILAFGVAQLVWGPVADRFGRRPVLLAGLALYTLASIGAVLAGDVMQVVIWRAVQGAAMSAAVVCARAMIRDLYEPQQGAHVMSRALSGLGLLAIASPLAGGLLVAGWGWRAAVTAMGVAGVLLGLFVALRLPETAHQRHRDATRLRPLLAQLALTLRHPGFRAWALLVSCGYGSLYVFLAGAGFVLIRVLGLSPAAAGAVMSSCSVGYIAGTFLCRRWLPRHGLAGAVGLAARFSLAACAGLLLLAAADLRSVWALMVPVLLFAVGHGVHQPCGQAGAVGPFPRAAGLASALAGFITALVAFAVGLWLGQVLSVTSLRPFALTMGAGAGLTALVAWTLVRRHGDAASP